MNIVTIPAYTYFTGDTTSYRTDQMLLCSTAFIEKMIETYPAITSGQTQVYSYSGQPITRGVLSKINSFFGDTLVPYGAIFYHAGYKSDSAPGASSQVNDDWSAIRFYEGLIGIHMNYFQVSDNIHVSTGALSLPVDRVECLNNVQLYDLMIGRLSLDPTDRHNIGYNFQSGGVYSCSFGYGADPGKWSMGITGSIFPDGLFDSNGLAPQKSGLYSIDYRIAIDYDPASSPDGVTDIKVYMTAISDYRYGWLYDTYKDFEIKNSGINIKEDNIDNPYDDDGESEPGGGDGGGPGGWIDQIDGPGIPSLPTINVCDLGLITMYNPSIGQVQALSSFLWSGAFDLNTYKKLFSDPMDGIIGLAIVPVSPSLAGSKTVKIGNVDSGVTMPYLSSNWAKIDCGWLAIEKFVGCFMDADPYTKIQIYLPFIGIRPLSADDINGGDIHVVYHVDVLTGACAAFIEHSSRGVLYTYNGSCITNVPLTAINFSGAIQNAVSAVVSGIGMVAGAATGAAPITAMGAAGLLNSAANTAINSKPNIQRSGNLGGSAGILSILKPYVIIERPRISMPSGMNKTVGYTSNISSRLDTLSGFTMVEYIHIENCNGTAEEIAEIESLLRQGVYL